MLLDEGGAPWSSRDLAGDVTRRRDAGRGDLAFVIGGPDGHGEAIRARAAATFSLGRITLPHQLARIVLAEQLYRAVTLISGHPYPPRLKASVPWAAVDPGAVADSRRPCRTSDRPPQVAAGRRRDFGAGGRNSGREPAWRTAREHVSAMILCDKRRGYPPRRTSRRSSWDRAGFPPSAMPVLRRSARGAAER